MIESWETDLDVHYRYWGSFILIAILCVILQLMGPQKPPSIALATSKFSNFQRNYLQVYLLATFSDWLQGPYVYQLYASYGFSQSEIAELFVSGYASSMVFGTFVGGLADNLGRKSMCIMFSICYITACFTKLVPNYWILLLGRLFSGISTSLLFSAFESWMIGEHFKQGFDSTSLSETFSYITFGNGLVAVCAGLIANSAASSFGFVAPFILAIIPLSVVSLLVLTTWSENYGNQQQNMMSSLSQGFELIRKDSRIAALGLGQSCFEGSMYTFVFMWTPALKSAGPTGEDPTSKYLGLIFAVFMVSVMVGSSLFKIFSARRDTLYKIPIYMHSVACLSMLVTTLFLENKAVVYLMFLVFECTVGLFYPSYGVIKSERIPEEIRSAVMNIFRIPLNGFVVLLLLKIKFLSPTIVFSVCTCAHFLALLCYLYFYSSLKVEDRISEKVQASKSGDCLSIDKL